MSEWCFGVLALVCPAQNFMGGKLPFHLRDLLFLGGGCPISRKEGIIDHVRQRY